MTRLLLVISLLFTLTACDSSEERAEEHFRNAMSLLEAGDPDRALIELRNVLKLNTSHTEARRLYADTVIERGQLEEGLAQYLRLAEQTPEDGPANRIVTQMLLANGDYEGAALYATKAKAALPDDPNVNAMNAAITYQLAVQGKDAKGIHDALEQAKAVLQADPDQFYARQTVMADLIENGAWTALLDQADAGLAIDQQSLPLHRARLMALERLGDLSGIETSLQTMTQLFPEEESLGVKLVNWYTRQGRTDDAEAWLAKQVGQFPDARQTLITYIRGTRGIAPALTALDEALNAQPMPEDVAQDRLTFAAMRAALRYENGERDQAINELRTLIEDAPESESKDRARMALATILDDQDQHEEAQSLVSATLTHDPSQVEALRLQASWMIAADETGDAILLLRKALDQAPDNAQVLATLSQAYEREGSRDLMSDVLMRAVEAANYEPSLTLRMVNVLKAQGQLHAAEELTIDALRRQNTDLALIGTLAEIHIAMEDWGRVTQDIQRLRSLDAPAATSLANELEGQQLALRRKTAELMQFVEANLGSDSNGTAMVVRSLILNDQINEATDFARKAYDANPEDPVAIFLYATTLGHQKQDAEAIALFRKLVTNDPTQRDSWMAIYNLLQRDGQMDQGLAVLDEALTHLPDDAGLLWIRASHMQTSGDIDQAIVLYEDLYQKNSDAEMIANNLASLLSTARTDENSLNRAYIIARRLQNSSIPAYQDTYGWIAYRRGELTDAVAHLESAASALSFDPTVQYHAGMAYIASNQPEKARKVLLQAADLLAQAPEAMPDLANMVNDALGGLAVPEQASAGN
ncbi:tetratricopeptide repeat protein [Donghicola sp. C2-DW-16]|uniref:Tetratricopeptide repeat protein n=1 Tax=Donghicola mangrovi TaxID=2729614 RepID=A0ABX2PGF9_9RHOB|nr:tetratricopeptide repeat protein [Donghicola mangrovi]